MRGPQVADSAFLDHDQAIRNMGCQHVHSVVLVVRRYSRDASPVPWHTWCSIFAKFQVLAGELPSFFCNQDIWSRVVATLQESMPSVMAHLPRRFNCFCSCPCGSRVPPPPCSSSMQNSAADLQLWLGESIMPAGIIIICCRPTPCPTCARNLSC